MTALTLTTYLGANSDSIATDLASQLTETTGLDIRFDAARPWSERKALIEAGEADLLWMCGLATVEAMDAGRLDIDIAAAPVFPDHPDPTYRSVVVARPVHAANHGWDLDRARVAINERSSWSGYHALRLHRPDVRPKELVETGSHAASIEALVEDRADLAAIDETIWTWGWSRDDAPASLLVVDRTASWPAPPFSIARRLDADLRQRLTRALEDARPTGLDRIVAATDPDYDPIRAGLRRSLAQPAW